MIKKTEALIFKVYGSVCSDKPEKYKNSSLFQVTDNILFLEFSFFSGGKPLYFHVTDPEGLVRLQLLSKENVKKTVIHRTESLSGQGTVPGIIQKGEWIITAFSFGARCSMTHGKVLYEVEVKAGFQDEKNPAESLEYENENSEDTAYVSWADRSGSVKKGLVLKSFEMQEKSVKDILNLEEESFSIPGFFSDYKIPERACRWLRGDFHVHSNLSDGSASSHQLIEEGMSKKLDFFFISEHGILSPSFSEKEGIKVFPSYEVTTEAGHMNLHGLRTLPSDLLCKGPHPEWKDLERILSELKKSGTLVSVNHPMLHPWEWLYNDLPLSMIDAVEVITDPYAFSDGAPEANEKALNLFDIIWNSGYRVAGIGGSDTHTDYSDSQLGQPVTCVYADPASMASVLDAVKKSRAAVFTDLDCSVEYKVAGTGILPGTDVQSSDDLDFEVIFDPGNDTGTYILRIIENGSAVTEVEALPGRKTEVKYKWPGNSAWIRCEIRDRNMIRGFINPVFRGAVFNLKTEKEKQNLNSTSDSPGVYTEKRINQISGIKTWGEAVSLLK